MLVIIDIFFDVKKNVILVRVRSFYFIRYIMIKRNIYDLYFNCWFSKLFFVSCLKLNRKGNRYKYYKE